MSFGFPAYHSHTETFNVDVGRLGGLVKETFNELGWILEIDSFANLQARIPIGLLSWGEIFIVSIDHGATVTMTSKCLLPTQCVDWGKNKRNVTSFLNKLRMLERSENAKQSAAPAGDGITPLTRLIAEND